jgi:hypothetical protein
VEAWTEAGAGAFLQGRRPPENRKGEGSQPWQRKLQGPPKGKGDQIEAEGTQEEGGQGGNHGWEEEPKQRQRGKRASHGAGEQATAADREAQAGFPERGGRDREGSGESAWRRAGEWMVD